MIYWTKRFVKYIVIVADYVGSFVDELSYLHNVTLKSQWLHLTEFDFQAKQVN